ncbi:M24 family metallopeptidase [Paramixta manurensis]|uniref:M24 family metallopeptidase n=1 Tax=Paramixta manurensis TaxID=2740817 RepID=A0A6M8UNJ4_9GAMM|nr:M24 family metallopeptidase [Erwiniaceae bacterium PD-1]
MTEKLKRLQQALADWQVDALLLTRRDNIAWLTEGASYYVVERAESGVASLLITADAVTLIAPDNELPRILAEEPLPFAAKTLSYPWYVSRQQTMASLAIPRLGSDTPLPGAKDLEPAMVIARCGLNKNERQRFAELGRETAEIVEAIARGVSAGVSEQEIEARILHDCLARAIRPVCTLIAVDERIAAYKHPTPGPTRLRQQLLITLGAERQGLNVSLTRMVHIGEPSEQARQRLRAVAEIHADIMVASRAERSWQAIFTDVQAAYARHGHAEGWQVHHQGGPAGYGCRDFIVTPESEGALHVNQALAWNPTLSGVKSEDTALLTTEGLSWLTRTGNWPMMTLTRGEARREFADWLVV